MGAACCVAARDATLSNRTQHEPTHRNITCSPSWSFHWDQRRVAGEVEDSSYQASNGNSRNGCREIKGAIDSERGNLSDGGSLENFGTPASPKSPVHEEMGVNSLTLPSDISMASNFSTELRSIASHNSLEVKNLAESPNIADTSAQKLSFSLSSSFSTPNADPLSTHAHILPPSSTPTRRARRSPGHRLLRQVSDSRILGLKSPNNYPASEGRSSFVLSACSNDLTAGSYGGSSDGWSMRTFSELVASSQRERWSFDSERFGRGNISGSSSRFSCSSSVDLQICGACSKLLSERSSWCSQRIIANSELSVVAVLVCGHVYHAECLEIMTVDTDRYEPACPICTVGEKQVAKMSRKALKAEAELKAKHYKISRNRVVDSYLDDDFEDFDYQKDAKPKGKSPKMEASCSTKSSSSKPFLRRHFSLGSKWTRSLTENDSVRKKGFWARYRKD
ncbi:hypothetical protein Ddye_007122 [Dipteronia dyeriana]|uniref:RING-type domain-containing protein n=1 Tax=Dipteronia dyeriana TaxID=168575 RepID=A0AAD9XJI2_9ROSI|nr:hypothetical protein Ddye_007122 [Dipteronia dyeriana]